MCSMLQKAISDITGQNAVKIGHESMTRFPWYGGSVYLLNSTYLYLPLFIFSQLPATMSDICPLIAGVGLSDFLWQKELELTAHNILLVY